MNSRQAETRRASWLQLRTHVRSEIVTDPENLRFRQALYGHGASGLVVALRRQVCVCSDCGDVSSNLQASRPGLERMPVLTLEDIRACLGEVRDHTKTPIDVAEAEARDRANTALAEAEAEFAPHRSLTIRLWELWLKFGKEPEITDFLTERARSEGLDIDAVPGAMRWLMVQGKTLHAVHRQEIEHRRSDRAPAAEGRSAA